MSDSRAGLLLHLALMAAFCITSLYSLAATAADEEVILLTFEGDLVGKVESLNEASDPALVMKTYYELLPHEVQTEIEALRLQLWDLIPDYNVAYTAADSAELVEVMDNFDVHWAAIRTIHSQEFTQEVVELLNKAYEDTYELAGPEK